METMQLSCLILDVPDVQRVLISVYAGAKMMLASASQDKYIRIWAIQEGQSLSSSIDTSDISRSEVCCMTQVYIPNIQGKTGFDRL